MAEGTALGGGDLKAVFAAATNHVKGIVQALSKQQMLELYGFYKQATEGPCLREKPRWYELAEKQKWEAWSALKEMDSNTAMEKYVNLLSVIDPEWLEKPASGEGQTGWVHHSCMVTDEEAIKDSEKTIVDWIKESNVDMVRALGNSAKPNELDEDGLGLIHWAADRGNLDIVKHLVENLKADVNLRDESGQTALHYAVSCDHQDVAEYLVQSGADVSLKDNDGLTPYGDVS